MLKIHDEVAQVLQQNLQPLHKSVRMKRKSYLAHSISQHLSGTVCLFILNIYFANDWTDCMLCRPVCFSAWEVKREWAEDHEWAGAVAAGGRAAAQSDPSESGQYVYIYPYIQHDTGNSLQSTIPSHNHWSACELWSLNFCLNCIWYVLGFVLAFFAHIYIYILFFY